MASLLHNCFSVFYLSFVQGLDSNNHFLSEGYLTHKKLFLWYCILLEEFIQFAKIHETV